MPTYENMALEWYTGASFYLSPYQQNFINYIEFTFSFKDVTKANQCLDWVIHFQIQRK